ncbi:hypothetical protein BGW36DRAFT_463373 [Talaromyces proteolyticus]|uniref:Uncharacterized protein n=1 Tax=Talaromyces proteolyticus TaxID=1131652 RepID=A0AAD4PXU3_9EURO|nr:uncharacterized protein BGW36DRAFT_463373 [Talaromyces proteolyticus]KAH8693714.1 hypothetical protein BGW36DRAFT_463373 [Talaromyces proteolyticus]
MMRTSDPRIRQTLNQISHNLESANETAQERFYTFAHEYLAPCFASIGTCLQECTAPCIPSRDTQLRRRRRGRAELNFDFYDDWDNDEDNDGLLGWGNDELDRLLAGSGGGPQQPRRQRKMSYGAARTRRKSSILPDQRNDPTVIPRSSIIGFLERFPWKLGSRGVKYRPSAADLQERPGRLPHDDDYEARDEFEAQPLMEEDEETNHAAGKKKQKRLRSTTQSSQETSNSLSSRGDLIFDDEDDEDAVPLDDEFAVTLARRSTGFTSDDHLVGSAGRSRRNTSGYSSRDSKSGRGRERRESKSDAGATQIEDFPSMAELAKEEQAAENEEELAIARRRSAAQQLAVNQGLIRDQSRNVTPTSDISNPLVIPRSNPASINENDEATEPFPSLPVTPMSQGSANVFSLDAQAPSAER